MPVHGTLVYFDPEVEDWVEYTDWLSNYFMAIGITDNTKKHAGHCDKLLWASNLSSYETFSVSRGINLFHICSTSWESTAHKEPKMSTIVRWFQFNSSTHSLDESVADYMAALQRLDECCAYGKILEEMLFDRLVCGINNAAIQRHLLA